MRKLPILGFLTATALGTVLVSVALTADEPSAATRKETNSSMANRFSLPLKTTGGTQLWTDHANRDGFRIQQNALTGHWRLIDSDDVRQAWGTEAECQSKLDELKPLSSLEKSIVQRPTVVLLHGLMRTHHCMKPLEARLGEEGFPSVIRFSYASTRQSVTDHAAALRKVLDGLPEDRTFCFVGHSMGNIVVRHLIGDLERDGDPTGLLPRFRSMVMLGPPNQGAAIARRLAPTGLYGLVTGKGGLEMGRDWDQLEAKLATPSFPFTIIAGDVSQNLIQNPLVDGSSDFVVSLEEARLEGAREVRTLPALHSFLMNDPKAVDWTIEFLNENL